MITQHDLRDFNEIKDQARATSMVEMVRDFAKLMDQPIDQKWAEDLSLEDFRWGLIHEEYLEAFNESFDLNNPANMFKELLDLLANTVGYAVTFGWDVEEGFRRVHQSNMSKLGLDGKPLKNSEGKVLKGPNYKPADLTDLVRTNNNEK
jgi:predicted HAD superfamily Cof-like phosphohydrolase|tara:strand:- start:5414 stop:5860 length:447 start_codon:yes stop_codon:yes gene_type:complete